MHIYNRNILLYLGHSLQSNQKFFYLIRLCTFYITKSKYYSVKASSTFSILHQWSAGLNCIFQVS